MKIRSVIIIGIIGIIVLGISVAAASNSYKTMQEEIRVAYFPNIGHAIPIVGIEKGIFEDHLKDVKIQTRLFDSGPQIIEALFADSIDIAYVGPGPAINGFLNSENNNVKILSGAASGGASFVVHPDSIEQSFSFDGKKIAAPQIGNTQDVSLRNYLSSHDLKTAEKGGSVIVHNIANPDIYTLFVKGDIDGAWVAEPWATILEQELGGSRIFYEEDLWPEKQFASVLLIANTDYVEKNPKIIKRWLDAHDATIININADKKDAGKFFNKFMTDTFGQSLDEDVVDIALANIKITSDPIKSSIDLFAKQADDLGYLGRNGYNLSGIFYNIDQLDKGEGD